VADGTVIIIGGAEDKVRDRVILSRFVSLAGGQAATIAVVSTASSLGLEAGERYRAIFGELGVRKVRPLHAVTRPQANDDKAAMAVRDATGVFLTGGNQLRLSSTIGGTRLADAILDRFRHGAVVAGTSAGASAMSSHMIAFGASGATPKHRMAQIAAGLEPLLRAGVVPVVLGGDHSVVLGELRAHAAVHGPVALVLLDAHADTWDDYYGERYFHGTPFRRALEEGLVLPERSIMAGMRGPLYSRSDISDTRTMGFEIVPDAELRELGPAEYGRRVRSRVGDAPVYMSFDIDVLDPAFAPGTGTPEVAGLDPREALALIRALAGMRFTGFDVVEVSPAYDGPGETTALLGASVAYEFLALTAVAERS